MGHIKSYDADLVYILVIKQEELDYIREIKEENIKLKETIRFKDRELETKGSEAEAVSRAVLVALLFRLK